MRKTAEFAFTLLSQLLSACSRQRLAPQTPPPVAESYARVRLGPDDSGNFRLSVSTAGIARTNLEHIGLRFTGQRMHGDAIVGPEIPIRAVLGRPAIVIDKNGFESVDVSVKLQRPPGRPGTYSVWTSDISGFANASHGTAVPFNLDTFTPEDPMPVSWPDDARGDEELNRLRSLYVGRRVYGYGHSAITCAPDWTHFYSPSTPLHIISIDRTKDRAVYLATGSEASAPYQMGLGFIAFDPLHIVVELADANATEIGSNSIVKGAPGRCPAIELAGWQFPITFSTSAPPLSQPISESPLHIGMTRTDVIWSRGYPNEIGTKSELLAESTWYYGVSMARYAITFRNERIASFTIPRG